MQKTIELKFDPKSIVTVKGRKVFLIEQFVKINEKGEQALLNLTVPVEHVKTKILNLTIDVEDAQIART